MSMCTVATVRGQHTFMITGYTFNKGLGVRQFIRSNSFNVGGFDWSIRYYPDGMNHMSKDYISVFVELMGQNVKVRAMYAFRLVTSAHVSQWYSVEAPKFFNSDSTRRRISGMEKFLNRGLLEGSLFLESDRLIIECSITIVENPIVVEAEVPPLIALPPSELSKDFQKMLESEEGADVTFFVKGETFPAHRIVLAARSPVFKAELCGPWKEKEATCITVEDMEPTVFRFLLKFLYTDDFLPLEDYDDNEKKEIVCHLIAAADRYLVERLKLVCENILCKNLDVETVAATLALADQHQCNNLKDACLKFMVSPDKMEKVMASEEYNRLKRKCPNLLVEVLESVSKFRKT